MAVGPASGHHARGVHRLAVLKTDHHGAGVPPTRASWPRRAAAPQASACEPYRELIVAAVGNAMAIWQDLADDHGFPGRFASVRRFVAKLRARPPVEARVVVPRRPTRKPKPITTRAPWSATRTPPSIFVLTLGCSRKAVRFLRWRSGGRVWAEFHERAFRRLGGTVRVVGLDNLKEGVLTPDVYDPALNPGLACDTIDGASQSSPLPACWRTVFGDVRISGPMRHLRGRTARRRPD